MKYKILVTGGTGFIGRNFIKLILRKKIFEIYSLSVKKIKDDYREKKVNYIFCKLENKSILKKKLDFEFDYVVNFAGYIDHSDSKKTFNSHYLGLKNLIDILGNKKIKKFIQIGSSVEYGFNNSPQKETLLTSVVKLRSIYGKAKLKSTNLLLKEYKKKNFPCIILRPYLVFGPGQNDLRLIPYIIKKCLQNESFSCSNGEQIRNFIYIKDFVSIVYKSLFIKISGIIINVGSNKNYTVKFIINRIKKIVGKGLPIYGKIKMRKDEPLKLYPNLTKFKKFINLKNEIKINSGLKSTIKYYKKT